MCIQGKLGSGLFVFLLALAGGGATALAAPSGTSTAGAEARPAHSTQALPATLRAVFYQALANDAGAAYAIHEDGCVMLPKQPIKGCFDSTGAHFTGTTPLSHRRKVRDQRQ
ncbi:MAG TPA: hypothetical protein VFX38_01475 [Gammaproteobacteria bacterium]|nr:hypothetical protein [Gammaproteobacteria bacterium]